MTITAISTPPGIGGIAVVRVSGPQAIAIVNEVFRPRCSSHTLDHRSAYSLTFGQIVQDNGETLDEVIVALYHAPHSFTGEDVVEISCHGSAYVQQALLQLLIQHGCRLADPGEFTRRAFANGRMDLSQAEAVADLIAAENAAAHRVAINQMKGGFSTRLKELRSQLLTLSSLLELELDFSEEDVEFADRSQLTVLAGQIHDEVSRLAQSFQMGNAIRNGIPVAIIGETNAGKSTLLNALVGDDRAIVSEIHGTTRDVVEDTCVMDGTRLRFIDTAGIRDTHDCIETLGIERTFQMLDRASIVLWMIDGTRLGDPHLTNDLIRDTLAMLHRLRPYLHPQQKIFLLINKADLVASTALNSHIPELRTALEADMDKIDENAERSARTPHKEATNAAAKTLTIDNTHIEYLVLSAKSGYGLTALRKALHETTRFPATAPDDIIVTNLRHYEALLAADEAILRVRSGLAAHHPSDLVAEDLRDCNHHLGTIVGEVTTDELLGTVFSRFCIGK